MNDINKRVTVFDPTAKTFTEIPARELSPGMIRVRIEGRDAECWMESSKVKVGNFKHDKLSGNLNDDIAFVQATFKEVFPQSIEDWINGFRRDTNPENEVAVWKRMAQVFVESNRRQIFDTNQRKDIFSILVTCTVSDRDNVLHVVKLTSLSKHDAVSVMNEFLGAK